MRLVLGQRRIEYRCLLDAIAEDSKALLELERRLTERGLLHKRREITPREARQVRLLVHKRQFDIAGRVLVEFSAELAPGAFTSAASHPSAVEG